MNATDIISDVAEKERGKIISGVYSSRVVQGRQNKHIIGTKEFEQKKSSMEKDSPKSKPSVLTYNAQALVEKFKGTGEIIPVKNSYPRETITTDTVIGQTWVVSMQKYIDTKTFQIIYSKTGVHVVPVNDKKGGK